MIAWLQRCARDFRRSDRVAGPDPSPLLLFLPLLPPVALSLAKDGAPPRALLCVLLLRSWPSTVVGLIVPRLALPMLMSSSRLPGGMGGRALRGIVA